MNGDRLAPVPPAHRGSLPRQAYISLEVSDDEVCSGASITLDEVQGLRLVPAAFDSLNDGTHDRAPIRDEEVLELHDTINAGVPA